MPDDKTGMFGPTYAESSSSMSGDLRMSMSAKTMEFSFGIQGSPLDMKPVADAHSATLGEQEGSALVPLINDREPFCETLAVRLISLMQRRSMETEVG
jgi:hypothetical protein